MQFFSGFLPCIVYSSNNFGSIANKHTYIHMEFCTLNTPIYSYAYNKVVQLHVVISEASKTNCYVFHRENNQIDLIAFKQDVSKLYQRLSTKQQPKRHI